MASGPDILKTQEMPAFPLHNGDVWGGMSLRDYLAAKALTGLLANEHQLEATMIRYEDDPVKGAKFFAETAYIISDAMLNAREGK